MTKLTNEQEKQLQKAFMIAFAKKLFREGQIDASAYNRLAIRIEKGKFEPVKK